MSSITTTMGTRQWALLGLLSVLWGGSFFFVEVAVTDLPPFTVVTLRVGLAALALWGVAAVRGTRPPRSRRVWAAFLGMGVLNNVVPFSLFAWGQTVIASGLASILNATTPLFTVVVAGLCLADERPGPLKLLGVAVGFAGTVVMIGGAFLGGLGGHVVAELACLGAALCYACAGVFGRRFKTMGLDPLVAAAGQVTGSTLVLLPLTLALEAPWQLAAPPAMTWAAVLGLAGLSTALAYLIYFRLLATAGATNLLLVTFLIPVSAIGLGAMVLGERLAPIHILGMAIIGLGLSMIDGRPWRRVRPLLAGRAVSRRR